MRPVTVGVAYTTRPWRHDLATFVSAHVAGLRLQSVRDLRAVAEDALDLILVDDASPLLDQGITGLARSRDIPVVAVWIAGEDDSTVYERLAGAADTVVDWSAPLAENVEFIRSRARHPAAADEQFEQLVSDLDVDDSARGLLVAVGGVAGAGRTEVAVGLAAWFSSRFRTLMIDTNDDGPHLSARLNVTSSPNLLDVLDARRAGRALSVDPLAASMARPAVGAVGPAVRFDVIAGAPNTRDWEQVNSHDVKSLLDTASRRWDVVVATVGAHLEDLSRWVDRFGVSRTVVGAADRIVAVGEPTATGVLRLVDWLVDLQTLRPDAAVDVVLNRVPASGWHRQQVEAQLSQIAGAHLGSVTELPFDRRVLACDWAGTLPRSGRWVKAVAPLAAGLGPAGFVTVKRRPKTKTKRRLVGGRAR